MTERICKKCGRSEDQHPARDCQECKEHTAVRIIPGTNGPHAPEWEEYEAERDE